MAKEQNDNEQTVPVQRKSKEKVGIIAYIALIAAILFFSGIFQGFNGPLSAFDFTNILGSFGALGDTGEGAAGLAENFRGMNGTGVRDGWLFTLSLAPAIIFALGVVQIVEDLGGLVAAENLLTPLLRPLLGISGSNGLALIASLQSTDAGAAMTKDLYDSGTISSQERVIFVAFQYSAGGVITNYLSSGAAVFPFLDVPIFVPLVIVFIFKVIAGNFARLYIRTLGNKGGESA